MEAVLDRPKNSYQPTYAPEEWFNALIRGNSFWPQKRGIIGLYIINASLDYPIDGNIPELSPDQLLRLGKVMDHLHQRRGVAIKYETGNRVPGQREKVVTDLILQDKWIYYAKGPYYAIQDYLVNMHGVDIYNSSSHDLEKALLSDKNSADFLRFRNLYGGLIQILESQRGMQIARNYRQALVSRSRDLVSGSMISLEYFVQRELGNRFKSEPDWFLKHIQLFPSLVSRY